MLSADVEKDEAKPLKQQMNTDKGEEA